MSFKPRSYIDFCRRHPVLSAVVLIAFVSYMVVCIRKGNDFLTYYELGRMSLQRVGHIYDSTSSTGMTVPYLPYFFVLMLPWALLPFPVSAGLWFSLKASLLARIITKFWFWSSRYAKKEKVLHVVLPLVVCANYLNNDFRLGQSNLIIHALLVFSFVALLAGKHVVSALLFVLSSFKVTPLAILPYFVIRRQWRFLLAVAGWAAVFCVLFILWFGWKEAASSPRRWLELTQSHKLGLLQVAEIKNQSLFGAVARSATDVVVGSGGEISLRLKSEAMAPEIYKYITYGLCLMLMGAVCLWTLLRKPAPLNLIEFSVFLVMMLLISPDTRSAHMVHLLLPGYILVLSVSWDRFLFRDHWWVFILCMAFLVTSRDLVGRTAYNYALYVSSQTLVMLLFLVLLVVRFDQSGLKRGQCPHLAPRR
jgi:hypothetical protein